MNFAFQNMPGLDPPPFNEAEQIPTIESVEPARLLNRRGGRVTIVGRGFASNATVTIGGQTLSNATVQSSTLITATLPPAPPGTQGVAEVSVRNPNGKADARSDLFRYFLHPFPFPSMVFDLGPGVSGSDVLAFTIDDLNGDGQPDVAAAGGDGVTLFLSNDWGAYDRSQVYVTQQNIQSVLTGDANSDGRIDVATRDLSGAAMVMEGDGSGGFAPAKAVASLPASFRSQTSADFDRDGRYASASKTPTFISTNDDVILRMNSNLPRYRFTCGDLFDSAANRRRAAVADLNGDSKLDLVVSQSTEYGAVAYDTLLGAGDGRFAVPRSVPLGALPPTTRGSSFVVADWNGDQIPDLVFTVTTKTSTTLGIMLGDGAGSFASPVFSPHPAIDARLGLVAADFNGDQKMDLATAGCSGSTNHSLIVFAGDGTGRFTPTFQTAGGGCGLAAGDFNGDKQPDIALTQGTEGTNGIYLFLNNGLEGFQRIRRSDLDSVLAPNALAVADLNGDGLQDLAMSTWAASSGGTVILGSAVDGLALPTQLYPGRSERTHIFPGLANPKRAYRDQGHPDLVIADFNLDGWPDIAQFN